MHLASYYSIIINFNKLKLLSLPHVVNYLTMASQSGFFLKPPLNRTTSLPDLYSAVPNSSNYYEYDEEETESEDDEITEETDGSSITPSNISPYFRFTLPSFGSSAISPLAESPVTDINEQGRSVGMSRFYDATRDSTKEECLSNKDESI